MKDPAPGFGRSTLVDPGILQRLEPSAARELLRHSLADRPPPTGRQVYVNRTLRMEKIRAIGFDLDWTLADYDQDALSELAFELTLDRLIQGFGYPPEILRAEYRAGFARRGLMLDTAAGTVLKMSRHRYVGRAYHGRDFLAADERARLYRQEPIQPAHERFHFVDTLFELPELLLFAELVELAKRGLPLPSPAILHRDARAAMDAIHADGTLKSQVLADLPRFLPRDPDLPLALARLALDGRKLILITNSEPYFSQAICSYLFEGSLPGLDSWRQLFDLVVYMAKKPGFFSKVRPFRVAEGPDAGRELATPEWGQAYSGGCREGLMQLLACPGEQVLYVGDHIYGDILSSKKVSTWRTALVVRELEDELVARQEFSAQQRHVEVLRSELAELGRRMDDVKDLVHLYASLVGGNGGGPAQSELARVEAHFAQLRHEHKVMREHKDRLQERISQAINPFWGSVFKQGSSKSLFGSQVDDFACVYTSRVSNLAFYGTHHYFRVLEDRMMHDDPV